MALIDKLNAIGNAIRAKTGKTEKLTLDQMPTEIQGIEGSNDKFWDAFQEYGKKTYYAYCFNNQSYVGAWFYPKYDIKPKDAGFFMRETKFFSDETKLDLVERLNECGVTIDFSNCANVGYSFFNARISHLPEINITKAENSGNSLLFGMYIETIDKFIFNENQTLNNTFGYCSALKNIVLEGVYKAGGLNMQWSTSLSKDSIISVINCLATDTSGLTVTLSLQAVNKAFETSEGANDGSTSKKWTDLIATRSNWTISLA